VDRNVVIVGFTTLRFQLESQNDRPTPSVSVLGIGRLWRERQTGDFLNGGN